MAEQGTLQFEHNMGRDRGSMRTKFEDSPSHDQKSTKRGNFWSAITSVSSDITKIVVFENTM